MYVYMIFNHIIYAWFHGRYVALITIDECVMIYEVPL